MKRPYCISGIVEKGMGRGRKLGFPTANLNVEKIKLLPKYGVYAGYTNRGELAAINIGENPTFENKTKTVEVHIIDLVGKKDLYGEEIVICLTKFIREDKKFKSLDNLKMQISKDIENIKRLNIKQTFTNKN
jgi:riboflavin kinase/FMN adenylyltransferase